MRRCLDEAAPVGDAECVSRLAADIEQVLRDVRKDDVPGAAVDCPEADQPLATADVEQALPRHKAGAVEHLVADAAELFEHLAPCLRVTAVAVLREPFRPDVAFSARISHRRQASQSNASVSRDRVPSHVGRPGPRRCLGTWSRGMSPDPVALNSRGLRSSDGQNPLTLAED